MSPSQAQQIIKDMNEGRITWDDNIRSVANNVLSGIGGGGGTAFPAFNFDVKAAEAAAMEELRPYYERILAEEGGDVTRAKARINDDYSTGVRRRTEDAATSERQFGITFPQEKENAMDTLNRRGLIPSALRGGLGSRDLATIEESQNLRREAVQRALQRQGEEAGLTQARATQDLDIKLGRTQFELGEEKKEKAVQRGLQAQGTAENTYNREYQRYQDVNQQQRAIDYEKAIGY